MTQVDGGGGYAVKEEVKLNNKNQNIRETRGDRWTFLRYGLNEQVSIQWYIFSGGHTTEWPECEWDMKTIDFIRCQVLSE